MSKFLIFIVGILLLVSFQVPAQGKKKDKTVCSTPVPSRFSAINHGKKTPVATSKKKLACCKGAPSRFASAVSVSGK